LTRGFLSWRFFTRDPTMQDIWYFFLIAVFAALLAGLIAGCAALGARR